MNRLDSRYVPRELEDTINNLDYQDYYKLVNEINQNLIGYLKILIQRQISELIPASNVSLSVVGSESRLESSTAYELFEIQVVHHSASINDLMRSTLPNKDGFSQSGDLQLHPVNIDTESTINFLESTDHKPHPSRPFDSLFLFGDKETHIDYKTHLTTEITSKDLRRIKKSRIRDYRRKCENSLSSSKSDHFDVEAGVAFFSPENYVKSFKYGPLRYLQESIVGSTLAYCSNYEDASSLVINMPQSTVSRLDYLRDSGVFTLSQEDLEELNHSYMYFLQIYHRSEFNFTTHDQSETHFNPQEAKEHMNSALRFTKSILT